MRNAERPVVHIVDDERPVLRSISFMLRTAGYTVQTWNDGQTFLAEGRRLRDGCAILDIRMPDMNGLEIQARLASLAVAIPEIVLTGHGDVSIAVKAMKAGATDFLEKPVEREVLLRSVAVALERAGDARLRLNEGNAARLALTRLTPREMQVLAELTSGKSNKEVAQNSGISARTVDIHRSNLMTKLGVKRFAEALSIAFAARVTPFGTARGNSVAEHDAIPEKNCVVQFRQVWQERV